MTPPSDENTTPQTTVDAARATATTDQEHAAIRAQIQVGPPVTLSGIWEDLKVHTDPRPNQPKLEYAIRLLITALVSSGFHMLLCYRIAAFFYKIKLRPLCIIPQKIIYHWYQSDMHGATPIGKGLWIPHPLNIMISPRARVGDHVRLMQNVQIHGPRKWHFDEPLMVGDRCRLNADAMIVRGGDVGHDSIVAARAFVNKPVPPSSFVLGMPAKHQPLREDQIPITPEELARRMDDQKQRNRERQEAEQQTD